MGSGKWKGNSEGQVMYVGDIIGWGEEKNIEVGQALKW